LSAATSRPVEADAARSLDRGALALAAVVFALALGVTLPAILGLRFLFERSEFYGHGYLVPVVAAYLAWGKRREIRRALLRLEPPRWGAPLALAVGSFELLMIVGDVGFLAGIGIPLVIGSAAYAVGGLRLLRPLALPLAFLALIVPPPRFVLYEILFRLKLLVTRTAVELLQMAGTPVLAEGNQILIPDHTLFVADACSGMTSIVTMLPIACTIAYFLTPGIWRRAAVVASVVPLALGANILRVILTVTLVPWIGIEAAQGSLHQSFGVATYAVGTLALIGIARILRWAR
jgi:exosortase